MLFRFGGPPIRNEGKKNRAPAAGLAAGAFLSKRTRRRYRPFVGMHFVPSDKLIFTQNALVLGVPGRFLFNVVLFLDFLDF